MSDERTLELISAAVDGELSDAERAELDRLIGESPEARRLHADLGRINSIMSKLPLLAPPETLHHRIMSAISLPVVKTKQPILGWLGKPEPFTVLRYGVATAAGAVLAAVLIDSPPRFADTADIEELVGTMAPNRQRNATDIVDSFSFRADGLESRVLLERRNGALLLDIQVEADELVDVTVNFADAGARLDALAQNQDALESIEIVDQTLRVRARGRRQLTALLHRVGDAALKDSDKIDIEFSSDGKLLQRRSLTPTWEFEKASSIWGVHGANSEEQGDD
jgi:hypothetical protein